MTNGAEYEVRILGAPRTPLRDFYYAMARLSWPTTILVIVLGYLLLNALFASAYVAVNGIAQAREGSWFDACFFSVQTMGTIGYGVLSPRSTSANALVVVESVTSLLFHALSTGLVFSKFSRPSARLMFSRQATISNINDVPTLAFRLGNVRSNQIVEASIRVAVVRTETTSEGKTFYRMVDLTLIRDRILSLSRAWTVMHVIDETSPLYGETPESLANQDAELLVSVVGTDDLWMQSVHGSHRYLHPDIAWGKRLVDIITEEPNAIVLDLNRFHDIEPVA